MRVEIIAVGSELLTPDRLDTNSLFITGCLNEIGIEVQAKSVVGDDAERLRAVFADALERADFVVLTGGLGPTDDDLTRDVMADVLERALEYDARVFDGIERRFAVRGLRTPEINRRQAMVPRGAVVLENRNGTAPGLWIEHHGKTIALLPGPPREMQPMMEDLVRDRLSRHVGPVRLYRRALRMTGRTESHVEEAVRPFYEPWAAGPVPIGVTILAAPGQIELHLTAKAPDGAQGQAALDGAVADVERVLGTSLFSSDGRSLEQVLGDLLRARGLRIALAESCTGGLVSSRLTDVPGSSDYLERGVVAYSNRAKVELLGVPARLIAAHGAVSEAVAEAMAGGIARAAGVDIGVGITGIAGPDGETAEKPVGTVAISAAWIRGTLTEARTKTWQFPGGREQIKFQASQAALNLVRRWLLAEQTDE
jgi:nicotinamide-nucleotide amidase